MNATEYRNRAANLFVRGDFGKAIYDDARELRRSGYTLDQLAMELFVWFDVWRISLGPDFPSQMQGVGITHIRRAVSLNHGQA